MVKRARRDPEVDRVQYVTPDVITKEVIEPIDYGKKDSAGPKSNLKICAECMDGPKGD